MSDDSQAKIRVFTRVASSSHEEIDLSEGTKAFVVLKPGRIIDVARRFRV